VREKEDAQQNSFDAQTQTAHKATAILSGQTQTNAKQQHTKQQRL